MKISTLLFRYISAVAVILALTGLPLHAVLVWQEGFTGQIVGEPPSHEYVSGKQNVWAEIAGVSDTSFATISDIGNPGNSLHLQDTSTTGNVTAIARLNRMAAFDTSKPEQSVLKLDFDMRIDASSNGTDGPGVQLYSTTSNSIITIGFGVFKDEDGTSYNTLFAGRGGRPAITAENAVGRTGNGTWEEGFDFGVYDSATSNKNNTGGFLHFELTYIDQSQTATLIVTNGANSASITITGITPATWSSTLGNSFSIRAYSSGISDLYVDNFNLSTIPVPIPEPRTAALLLGAGMPGILLVARRLLPRNKKKTTPTGTLPPPSP
ncbi:MAG: hypothetical protein LBK99_09905 [Opitutaceae bacterium]|jgi:hypothetical protein|nr:hypothetical protein [Opitutaceae bacterium]